MPWNKSLIEINNLPGLRDQIKMQVKTAHPDIDKIRCIFGYKEDPSVYMYTAFDFLDKYQDIINQGALEKFYVYQPLK